jgi:predicted O-methyltransferase YrrM
MANTIPAKVDAYINAHLTFSNTPLHAVLKQIQSNSISKGLDDIAVTPAQGKYLALQARLAGATNILEIGTLGAYSTVWLTTASPTTTVTSIELDPHAFSVARENVSLAGVSDRVTLHCGHALEILPHLRDQIRSSALEPFDFAFIDADKQNNLPYLNYVVDMVSPKTVVIVDNVVRGGRIVDEAASREDPKVIGTRRLIEAIKTHARIDDAVILQTEGEKGYDGFLMAIVK